MGGPYPGQVVTVKVGFFSEITLVGVGLTFSDRIFVVNSTVPCQRADRFDQRSGSNRTRGTSNIKQFVASFIYFRPVFGCIDADLCK